MGQRVRMALWAYVRIKRATRALLADRHEVATEPAYKCMLSLSIYLLMLMPCKAVIVHV